MTRMETRNLSIMLIGAALICGGYAFAASGVMWAGAALSLVGSLVLLASVMLITRDSRRNRNDRLCRRLE